LDAEHRSRVLGARDHYEEAFRSVIRQGVEEGSFRPDTDPKTVTILLLSMLNAIERWYHPGGPLGRRGLVERILELTLRGIL
ncbi:MAG: TetR/AcrR family transcriptional regulator, partial [Actinobacteria bacterium]|nr:TetR/AcrR family transcriptional regulator [Actinomycetota bacterium]